MLLKKKKIVPKIIQNSDCFGLSYTKYIINVYEFIINDKKKKKTGYTSHYLTVSDRLPLDWRAVFFKYIKFKNNGKSLHSKNDTELKSVHSK